MPERPPAVVLPPGTVDLTTEVVPAVRALLRRGLPKDFVEACVRIGAFEAFGGGYKSELVGGLRIDVNSAMKLGGAELERHVLLMQRVNRTRPRTFPTVQALVRLEGGRRLLFMEQLLGHETLLDLVYRQRTRGSSCTSPSPSDGPRSIRRVAARRSGSRRPATVSSLA